MTTSETPPDSGLTVHKHAHWAPLGDLELAAENAAVVNAGVEDLQPAVVRMQDDAATRYARSSAVENLLDVIEATTEIELTTQDELLTAIDEMLDNSVHSEQCYVNPDDTVCFCLIGKVRAALPKCEMHQLMVFGRPWRCTRTAHPASPDRHVFGEV